MRYICILMMAVMSIACDDSDDSTQDQNNNMDSEVMDSDSGMNDSGIDDTETTANGYTDISAAEVKAMIENDAEIVVVDVSPVYDDGHIPGAVNYYVGDGSLDDALTMLDKLVTYIVYCHSDGASILGAEKFVAAGFENVFRLQGNYGAWISAGYEVEVTE